MLTEAGRLVLEEIATHGRARHYSRRSKFVAVASALRDLRLVRGVHGRYEITDAGREALAS